MFDSVIPRLASVVDGGSEGRSPGTMGSSVDERGVDARLRRASAAAGLEAGTIPDGDGEFDIDANDIARVLPEPLPNRRIAKAARNRAKVLERPLDADRAGRIATVAREGAANGLPPSAYAASYLPLFERAVERAFDRIREGDAPEKAEAELLSAVRAGMVDMQIGVDEFATEDSIEPLAEGEYATALSLANTFDALPYSAFLIDDENTVLEYNSNICRQLGLEPDHREFIGKDCRDTLAAATYTDGSRYRTLADKIAETPVNPESEWDIERRDEEYSFTEDAVYGDSSVSVNTEGGEVHIEFLAIPFYDDDGELTGILELIEDRSTEMRHQQAITDLVGEITDTLDRMGNGDLSARVDYEDEHDVVSEELLGVTEEVNSMADSFEQLVGRVERKTEELSASIERATESAHRIDEQVDEQNEALEEVGTEMESFSAAMEEVAASSNEVAEAADRALKSVESGVDSGTEARTATEEVSEMGEELVESVTELDENMGEIEEVVEIIAEVADQTNILALNANIEAARVDTDGDGFAVVADEVKTLANETQQHTKEIGKLIETIQSQTDATVADVERTHERIETADEEIISAIDALEDVAENVEDAAEGITEVAEANDEQAATVEEVTATVDEARERASRVATETDDIVEEAEAQSGAIGELSERVDRLTGEDSENRTQ